MDRSYKTKGLKKNLDSEFISESESEFRSKSKSKSSKDSFKYKSKDRDHDQTPRFTDINEGFICEHCGRSVPPSQKSCRNHCPYCLYSKHVDINPGDRASRCLGLMRPVFYELSSKKGIVLGFQCLKCGAIKKNKADLNDSLASDDYSLILSLMPSSDS